MARQERIGFYGKFRPTGVDTSGAEKLKALAGLSSQVSGMAFQEGTKQREKQGKIEGAQSAQRDEEGKLIPMEQESEHGIFGRSFNQAAIVAHRAQVGIDTKAELDRIQEENKLDPAAFENAAQGSRKGMLKGMNPELAAIVSLDYDQSVSSRLSKLNSDFAAREHRNNQAVSQQRIESFTDDILNATRSGDDVESARLLIESNSELNAMVESGIIDPVAAEKTKENIRERILNQKALSDIDEVVFNEDLPLKTKIEKGYALLKDLRKEELEDLNPEQKDTLLREVGNKIRGLESEYKSMLSSEKKEIDYSNIEKKRSGGHPEIVLDQKVVDSYYSEVVALELQGSTDEERTAEQAKFVATTKYVPKALKQEISNSLLSGDVDLIVNASDTLTRLEKTPGLAESIVKPGQRAFAQLVSDLSKNMTGDEAVERARTITDPRNKPEVERREQEIKDNEWRDDYQDWATDEFPTIDGVSSATVTKEFSDLFESYYKTNPDESTAREYANDTIARNWKESEFGFMKYPPELYYDTPSSVMREQLARDIKDRRTYEGDEKIDFNNEDLFLMTDKRTSNEAAKGRPTYRVMIRDTNGQLHILDKRFQPDDSQFKDKQLDANIKRARAMFEGREEPKTEEEITKSLGFIR